jgi:hypothetical protein
MRHLQILFLLIVLFTTVDTTNIDHIDVDITEILRLACDGDLYAAETLITLGRNNDDSNSRNDKNAHDHNDDYGEMKNINDSKVDGNYRNNEILLRKEKETASSLHIQSAFKFILYADAKAAVELHKMAKSRNPTTVPPLAGIYIYIYIYVCIYIHICMNINLNIKK